jgi:hypothetical protein
MSSETQLAVMSARLENVLQFLVRSESAMRDIQVEQRTMNEQLMRLSSLNIQERFAAHSEKFAELSKEMEALKLDRQFLAGERRGMEKMTKAIWALCTFVGLSTIAGVIRLFMPGV